MKQSTVVAVSAIVNADPPRTAADKSELRRILGLADDGLPEAGDRILTFAEAGRLIGRGKRSIHHLARRGVIQKFTLPGTKRAAGVLLSDIHRMLAG